MTRLYRPGPWRRAALPCTAVLPTSIALDLLVVPLLRSRPDLAIIAVTAALLVATLHWLLLPALQTCFCLCADRRVRRLRRWRARASARPAGTGCCRAD